MVNKDKIAIITGSSAGLGASVAISLAKKGVNVVINYTKSESEAKKIEKICVCRLNTSTYVFITMTSQ